VHASFGRYELIQPLDRGGMGEVYLARARGPERVQKTVVLKRMRPERANDEIARARFADEARVAVSLVHPHIVPVFEFGELDGEYFLVMEWLRGGSLSRIVGFDRPSLPWPAVALVGSQLCDALGYVHARTNRSGAGLVHGDLTPRNILLSTDGHALLADFGLARFAGRSRAGTVRYLAPEQARGEAVDARADLYSLALVLSEAATGRPAYDRDPERAEKQAKFGVIPDFTGVDPELASLLRHALAANVDGRYPDAAAMGAAFESLLDREPGVRAAARAALVTRIGAAIADGDNTAASATRTSLSVAGTREATHAPEVRRRASWLAAAALGFACAGGLVVGVIGRVGRRPASAAPIGATVAATPSPTAAANSAPSAPVAAPPASVAAPNSSVAAPNSSIAAPQAPVAAAPAPVAAAPARHRSEPPRRIEEPAQLDLNATPWAHVRIDGQHRGETPLLGLVLPPGEHRIELTNEPLGLHRELTITLTPGQHLQRVEDLAKP
jgi:tRNA A-37 threonylcarbamoyl transferase component Bud32